MNFSVFIDYDNLLDIHKISGVRDIVTKALLKALIQAPINSSATRGTCSIRVYGGWYEGTVMTQLAQDVAVAVQREFPAIIHLPTSLSGQNISLAMTAELAVALLEEPSHHLFNTYRKKGKPTNVRVQTPAVVGCSDIACPLPQARKLIRTGKCPISTCIITTSELVYRHEQKIVDTMLTCDLIYTTQLGYDRVILISGDDDFLPPIRTALLRGTTIVRFMTKPNRTPAAFPPVGAALFQIEL